MRLPVRWPRPPRPPYPDLLVVAGDTVRSTLEDYSHLVETYPETILGYRVLLTTTNTSSFLRTVQGLQVTKVIVFQGPRMTSDSVFHEILRIAALSPLDQPYEEWTCHRPHPPHLSLAFRDGIFQANTTGSLGPSRTTTSATTSSTTRRTSP